MTYQTLTRAALESCAATHYPHEPVDVTERLRRGMNVYLESYAEQVNMTSGEQLDGLARSLQRMQNIITAARQHEFGTSKASKGRLRLRRPMQVPYLGPEPPGKMERVRRMLTETGQDDAVGLLVCRMTSAFAHGDPNVLNLLNLRRLASSVEGMGLAQVRVSTAEVARDTGGLVYGLHKTMLRICEHYGWDETRWQSVAQPTLRYWSAGLAALPRS